MKKFESLVFDPVQCLKELDELRALLSRQEQLDEKKHILPFFRKRRHLSAFIASNAAGVIRLDRIAFEYELFGDFTCDIVVGDSVKAAYCFVEFEDAGPNSLFIRHGKKVTREWSSRFDHGYSQIIDWFHKLDDMKRSDAFAMRFGAHTVSYSGAYGQGGEQAQASANAIALSDRLLSQSQGAFPPGFVVDVGMIEDRGWAVVEFNPAWCSGLLGANPRHVLAVLQRVCLASDKVFGADCRWVIER